MANLQRMTTKRLGEIMTHSGLISSEQLDEVLADQKKGQPLGELLVDRGYVTERDVAEVIATQFGLPYLSPKQYYASADVTKLLPVELMKKHGFVPIDKMGSILTIVISGPLGSELMSEIEKTTGCTLEVYVGTTSEVNEAIENVIGGEKSGEEK